MQIIGTYRCLPGKKQGHTTGIFRTSIIANNVQHLQKDQAPSFFENDIPMIRKFGKGKDPFRKISKSLYLWINNLQPQATDYFDKI